MQKYTAIIIFSRDANEFDRIYTMYTLEQGLVRAVARGARKPAAKLVGHLEPVTFSEVYVARARGRGQITGAITIESFENIKKNLEKLRGVLEIFSFLTKFFRDEERDEKVFKLLHDFLLVLNKAEVPLEILGEAFWWKLFEALGQKPEVRQCLGCGERLRANSKKFFSVEQGGIICTACFLNFKNATPISDNQIKLLRIFWSNPLSRIVRVKIEKEELAGLARIRENFTRYGFG